MKKAKVIVSMLEWFNLSEWFIRPSKHLPGRWSLYEYYWEPEGNLINLKEAQMKRENQHWELTIEPQGKLGQSTNLPVQFLDGVSRCKWYITRNFITWIHGEKPDRKIEFQYAIVNGNLKLLKKDRDGRIQFFGFFRRTDKT